jgi:hypothetical protein
MTRVSQKKADALQAALDEYGVRLHIKRDGYRVWWYAVAAWLVKLMFFAVYVLSFGAFNKDFDRDFATTFGRDVYLSNRHRKIDLREYAQYQLVRHELMHVIQADEHGAFWFRLSYLLVLPAGWTYRAKWEMEAYTQQMIANQEEFGRISDGTLSWIEGQFVSPSYLFMRPFRKKVRSQLEEIRDGIERGDIRGMHPYRPDLLAETA